MKRKTTTPSAKWVASKAVSILKRTPDMGPKDMQIKLQDDHKCVIGYDTVWKGLEKAFKELYGSWEDSFGMLYNWKAEVIMRMPGSIIEIDVEVKDGLPYFHRFFCALGPCIEGFLEGCRPYLIIDSTALSGRWNGQLATTCSVDGHNWMYPVAYGFIDKETYDNWKWWIAQLHKAIGDVEPLAICSDACKGLENAVKYVFHMAEQRECFKHLMDNYAKRKRPNADNMYPAARSYRKEVHEHHIAIVKSDLDTKEWLEQHHKLKWFRSGFNPAIKCDYVTNNIAKVFNKWIKDIKDLPVCELADKLREMIMVLWHKRRKIGQRLQGKILPAVIHILKAQTRGLSHLNVVQGDYYAAQVVDISAANIRHVVKAYLHECTCEEWQHTGKPCQHALALITQQPFRDVMMENFVNDYYSVERFKNAYKRIIEPLPDRCGQNLTYHLQLVHHLVEEVLADKGKIESKVLLKVVKARRNLMLKE
ncbi:Unknown protein [Striga hermonthica]|uniref:SWIM-type domain-containing protein n=1 Tax=Striga hermonthica TaxID=68872 RepID=A0A9N7NH01_STRHE|nr:Unknown protein [Striga hermonthica]